MMQYPYRFLFATLTLLIPLYAWSMQKENPSALIPQIFAEQYIKNDTSSWYHELYDAYLASWYHNRPDIKISFMRALKNKTCNTYAQLDTLHQQIYDRCFPKTEHISILNTQPPTYAIQTIIDRLPAQWQKDYVALTFAQQATNTYIGIIFPQASHKIDAIKAIIRSHTDLAYCKAIPIRYAKAPQLIRVLYAHEDWIGSSRNTYRGAREKANLCFSKTVIEEPCYALLMHGEDITTMRLIKKEIRNLFKGNHHTIHITDTHAECVRVAQTVFNDNSLHFINYARQQYCPRFHALTQKYRAIIKKDPQLSKQLCIDGSAVLSAYGLRDCHDLDFLHHTVTPPPQLIQDQLMQSHNHEVRYYPTNCDALIFDPRCYWYDDGIKYVALGMVRAMKQKRNEAKDRKDCKQIDTLWSMKL